jgi:Glycosyltransferase Family 4
MKIKKKILFLQEFSMERKGGGVSIIKRLVSSADHFNYRVKIAYDRAANKGYPINADGQTSFYSLPRNTGFGIGKLMAWATLFSLDIFCFFSLVKLIRKEKPELIHITAHGVCLPLMVRAARFTNKKIVISVHDLWFFSVNGYISEPIAERFFKRLIKYAGTVYVISPQMGDYLYRKYGEKNYQVVHDGIHNMPAIRNSQPFSGHLSFFYAGLLHAMQMVQFNKLVDVLGGFTNNTFTIGICSSVEYRPEQNHGNVKIVNYGWVSEDKIKELSKEYAYGLLPLSFDPADELFYRTSLMTKIPFYISVLLPVICIGPQSASAVQLILREKTGLVAISGKQEDISVMINELLELTPERYQQFVNHLKRSALTTFNIELIAKRFYGNLFPPAIKGLVATA